MQDDQDRREPLEDDAIDHDPAQASEDHSHLYAPEQAYQTVEQIDFDLNCVRCGYNLRGTTAAGRCPECGEPVETTLRPDLLHTADPAWLGKLRKGSNWLIVAIIVSLAMIPVGMVIGVASASSPNPSGTLPTGTLLVLGGLGLIFSAIYAVAIWLMTEPEPDVNQPIVSRSLARWLIVPSMVIGIFPEFLNATGQTLLTYVATGIDIVSAILMTIGFLASLKYLRLLADRIPEPSLAKQTMTVFWGSLVTMLSMIALTAVIMLVFLVATTNSNAAGPTVGIAGILGLLMCPVGLGMLVFGIWWIVLMFHYRTRFTQAHQIAMQPTDAADYGTSAP